MEIRLAQPGDLTGWMQLVEPMRRLFPGLETPESMEGYAGTLPGRFPGRRRSVQWKTEQSAECWPFPGRKELAFLAVSGQHRRRGIARKLAERMFRELDPTRPVRLITYREGSLGGRGSRALYQELGFCPGELVEVEGSPAQEFLRPADNSERSVSE